MKNNKKTKKPTLADLLKRIEVLERRQLPNVQPIYYPPYPAVPPINTANTNLHFHGTFPCYNNPCVWY